MAMRVEVHKVTDTSDVKQDKFKCGAEHTFRIHGGGFADPPNVKVHLEDKKGKATWTDPDPRTEITAAEKGKKLEVKAKPSCKNPELRGIGDLTVTVTNTLTGDQGKNSFGVDYT
jgi:hypothetical protein